MCVHSALAGPTPSSARTALLLANAFSIVPSQSPVIGDSLRSSRCVHLSLPALFATRSSTQHPKPSDQLPPFLASSPPRTSLYSDSTHAKINEPWFSCHGPASS